MTTDGRTAAGPEATAVQPSCRTQYSIALVCIEFSTSLRNTPFAQWLALSVARKSWARLAVKPLRGGAGANWNMRPLASAPTLGVTRAVRHAIRIRCLTINRPHVAQRASSTQSKRSLSNDNGKKPGVAALNPRWLSDVKQRIGKCITFGLRPHQSDEAASILAEITADWRELVAGSEGYLTSPQRRGLYRHKVVWGEQDSMGHVNNVMYNRYAESGRVEWVRRFAEHIDPANAQLWRDLVTPKGFGVILGKITTEFKFPMRYPDRISVYHRLLIEPSESTTAFAFEALILSEKHQRIAARVTEDCSLYDYVAGKKATMKPSMADVLRQTWMLQEEAKVINSARVHGLLARVRTLETDSWDREGAVEDLGSAS